MRSEGRQVKGRLGGRIQFTFLVALFVFKTLMRILSFFFIKTKSYMLHNRTVCVFLNVVQKSLTPHPHSHLRMTSARGQVPHRQCGSGEREKEREDRGLEGKEKKSVGSKTANNDVQTRWFARTFLTGRCAL